METDSIIAFLLLFLTLVIIYFLQLIAKEALNSHLKEQSSESMETIGRFLKDQSFVLYSVICVSFALTAFYHWQMAQTKEQVHSLKADKIIDAAIKVSRSHTPKTQKKHSNEDNNNMSDSDNTQLAHPSQPKNTIQDIFGVRQDDSDLKGKIDRLKIDYEELFITHFILQKCRKINNSDYQTLTLALQKGIADLHAPIHLQYDILTAAKGSYDEIYSHNKCSKLNIQEIYEKHNRYIQSLSPPPATN